MSSKFIIDSMLPKYHQQFHHQQLFQSPVSTSSIEASLASVVNYSSSGSPSGSSPQHSNSSASSTSPASRMYPYVSAATAAAHHHHQQQAVAAAAFGAAAASGSMVPGGFPSSASTAALAAAAAVDAAADKSCRYTAGLTGNVGPTDSMVNYTLGHHHQNGAAVSAAASSVSAASASMAVAAQFYHQAASAVVDPLTSCSQTTAPGGQPIPDIPRYPWMSITDWMSPFDRVVCDTYNIPSASRGFHGYHMQLRPVHDFQDFGSHNGNNVLSPGITNNSNIIGTSSSRSREEDNEIKKCIKNYV
ncbi:homeobox protein abdominal-A homolog isoform X4 [Diorhabda carinulata]|uniref:homeobox protein abdominal-A homolog isoform X4 n=1 Tax=Diorhabda carinulata TaxID=1163345 RepID=UPI0025A00064|nr:homeobox protein abdominal-A homolog isoform X4 [Diorhabda carinulata]